MRINKSVLKHNKDLKVKGIMFLLRKLIKFFLSSNDDKRMQSIDLIETNVYGTCKGLVSEKEIKCSNIMKQYKK